MPETSWKGATNGEKAVTYGHRGRAGRAAASRLSGRAPEAVSPMSLRTAGPGGASTATVLVDPLPLFRAGARAALASRRLAVVGEADGVAEGVELARHSQARVLVLGGAPVREVAEAASCLPGCAVVALLAQASRPELVELLDAGVAGLALRSLQADELVSAVEAVAAGARSVEPVLVPLLAGFGDAQGNGHAPLGNGQSPSGKGAGAGAPPGPLLTSKERLVLAQLARGSSNNQIAQALYVTPATVKTHLAHIYAKLGATSRHQALTRALELGMLP